MKLIKQDYFVAFGLVFHLGAYFITRFMVFGLPNGTACEMNSIQKAIFQIKYFNWIITAVLFTLMIFVYLKLRADSIKTNNFDNLNIIVIFYVLFVLRDFLNDLAFVIQKINGG